MTRTTERLTEIKINGRTLATGASTLDLLVAEQDFGGARVATAVNGEFVPERRRAEIRLADGDHVEIVSIRQGG